VAGSNEYSMSQQTDTFDYFSKLKIYKYIIASQEHYVSDAQYSTHNDVGTGMKLVV
jgi:hypothetical protein